MKPIPLQTPAQLSAHLRSLRRTRGFTQAALGELVGLDQTRIAKIERDPSRVSVGQLIALLSALGVQITLATTSKPAAKPPGPKHADW